VTFFTNGLDPVPRSRQVFNFRRPETLAEWAAQPTQLRARLKQLPQVTNNQLIPGGLTLTLASPFVGEDWD
jgi:type I restriction enzyme, R subunit